MRRRGQQFVAVTCHEDVEAWLDADWVYRPAEETAELYRLGTDPAELDNLAPPPDDLGSDEASEPVNLAPVAAGLKREPRAEAGDSLRAADPAAYRAIVQDLLAELRTQGFTAHPAVRRGLTEA